MTELKRIAEGYVERILEGKGARKPKNNMLNGMILGLAKKNHEAWCQAKKADGYVYGEIVDDMAKTTNLLVDFEDLPVDIKEANIRNAKKTISLIFSTGFEIHKIITPEDKQNLINSMAEALHDEWALGKIQKGYTFGVIRNDDPEKGPLKHRNILPFEVLLKYYPEDAEYDVATATGIVEGFEEAGFRICYSDETMAIGTC